MARQRIRVCLSDLDNKFIIWAYHKAEFKIQCIQIGLTVYRCLRNIRQLAACRYCVNRLKNSFRFQLYFAKAGGVKGSGAELVTDGPISGDSGGAQPQGRICNFFQRKKGCFHPGASCTFQHICTGCKKPGNGKADCTND